MAANLDKPHLWKDDIAASVAMFNEWYIRFAPSAFKSTRERVAVDVTGALESCGYLLGLDGSFLRARPEALATLRHCTAPPIAADRLSGLAEVPRGLIRAMEKLHKLPTRAETGEVDAHLQRIASTVSDMVDDHLFDWVPHGTLPNAEQARRTATVVADRLCGTASNPIIRNAQERRQLVALSSWLHHRGYSRLQDDTPVDSMGLGTFGFHKNVPVRVGNGGRQVNVSVDAVIRLHGLGQGGTHVYVEAKSAGDFANTNKRRKEEAVKAAQLRAMYGSHVPYVLVLCGYFDSGYLGYEAAEGIDWVWEHRLDDLTLLGV